MKANELCPAPHLECADLNGEEVVATIVGVEIGEVGNPPEQRGKVKFKEFDRLLVLNRTNLKRIIHLYGTETDDWTDKRVTLYPSETDFGGKTVECIRVREKAPK